MNYILNNFYNQDLYSSSNLNIFSKWLRLKLLKKWLASQTKNIYWDKVYKLLQISWESEIIKNIKF